MVPYATGERELAAEYLLYSRPDDLFLYDRGYPAFWLFAFHAKEQRHYCARVRHDFHSEVKAFVADGANPYLSPSLIPPCASMVYFQKIAELRIPRQRDRRFQTNVTAHSNGS